MRGTTRLPPAPEARAHRRAAGSRKARPTSASASAAPRGGGTRPAATPSRAVMARAPLRSWRAPAPDSAAARARDRQQAVRDGLRQHRPGCRRAPRSRVSASSARALRCAQHRDAGARAQRPSTNQAPERVVVDQRLQVVEQGRRCVHALHRERAPAARRSASSGVITAGSLRDRRRVGRRRPAARARSCLVGVAEGDAHEEAVELRLGQRVGAELVGRVLRRDDEERRRAARAGLAFDASPGVPPSPRASALCVFGPARLISSARSTCAKTGPGVEHEAPRLLRS